MENYIRYVIRRCLAWRIFNPIFTWRRYVETNWHIRRGHVCVPAYFCVCVCVCLCVCVCVWVCRWWGGSVRVWRKCILIVCVERARRVQFYKSLPAKDRGLYVCIYAASCRRSKIISNYDAWEPTVSYILSCVSAKTVTQNCRCVYIGLRNSALPCHLGTVFWAPVLKGEPLPSIRIIHCTRPKRETQWYETKSRWNGIY